MSSWIKILSISSITVTVLGLILYIFTKTAGLQKTMDIVGRLNVLILGGLTVLFALIMILLLYKNWLVSSANINILVIILSLSLVSFSAVYYEEIYIHNSQSKKILSDSSKTTEDGKYKYHLELVNLYQKNQFEQLVIQDTATNKINYIKIDLIDGRLKGYSRGDWALLYQTDSNNQSNIYLLESTENLLIEKKLFQIDLDEWTVKEIR